MKYLAYMTLGMVIGAVIGVGAYAATAPPIPACNNTEATATTTYTSTVTVSLTRPAQVIGLGIGWELLDKDTQTYEVHISGYVINVGDKLAPSVRLEVVLRMGDVVVEKVVYIGDIPPLGYRKVDAYMPFEYGEPSNVEVNITWG